MQTFLNDNNFKKYAIRSMKKKKKKNTVLLFFAQRIKFKHRVIKQLLFILKRKIIEYSNLNSDNLCYNIALKYF